MDQSSFFFKSIILLYRQFNLEQRVGYGNFDGDMVFNLLSSIKQDSVAGKYISNDISSNLKTLITKMSRKEESVFDEDNLVDEISLICRNDETYGEKIIKGIKDTKEMTEAQLKRSISNLIKDLNNVYIEEQIEKVLETAYYKFKKERNNIKDINEFVLEVLSQLEPLNVSKTLKDPAVKAEIDLSDPEAVNMVFEQIKKSKNEELILQTGWKALNKMLQGGFRRGEFAIIAALQHKYKTGLTLSIFKQIAIYNKPSMIDPNKKPLLLRISFEDDLTNNLEFLYRSLKLDEDSNVVDISKISTEEMQQYVYKRLGVNGYNIKMMRVDPTSWSYRDLLNKILEYEAQGYEIHLLMVDYLGMLPTVGCYTSGPMGTDIRDMFRRLRNFCSPRKICFITPHQISPSGKALLRDGNDNFNFVKEINGKGYYSGSAQLDQEVDLEIYAHIVKYEKKSYLTLQRGKHRIPTINSESDQYFILEFPKNGTPIPDDLNRDKDTSLKSVSSQEVSEELFKLG